ncbi:MAG TPA: hypothetical protein VL860_01165, partial [Planctomycetota bacterium]|nr:hypothetical protein [Planctomycetota bacterium]
RQFKSGLNEVADQAMPSQQPASPYPQPPMPQFMNQTGAQPAFNPNATNNPGLQQPMPPPGYPYYYPPPPAYYPPQPPPGQPMLGPDGRPLPPPPPGYGYYPLPPQQQPMQAPPPPNNQSGPWAPQPPQAPGSNSSQRM